MITRNIILKRYNKNYSLSKEGDITPKFRFTSEENQSWKAPGQCAKDIMRDKGYRVPTNLEKIPDKISQGT